MKDRIRYSEAFKLKVMEELRDAKWKSVQEAARAYGIAEMSVYNWMHKLGFEHLNGRLIYVKTRTELDRIKEPVAHSDRGCQYASRAYREALEKLGWRSSMTEELHCYENARTERLNGILKYEYFLNTHFKTKKEYINVQTESTNHQEQSANREP